MNLSIASPREPLPVPLQPYFEQGRLCARQQAFVAERLNAFLQGYLGRVPATQEIAGSRLPEPLAAQAMREWQEKYTQELNNPHSASVSAPEI